MAKKKTTVKKKKAVKKGNPVNNLGAVTNEVFSRVDQGDGPALKKSGLYEIGQAFFDVIGQMLVAGEDVAVPRFGKFKHVVRPPRMGRNPATNEKIKIGEKKAVKFTPSSVLKTKVADEG